MASTRYPLRALPSMHRLPLPLPVPLQLGGGRNFRRDGYRRRTFHRPAARCPSASVVHQPSHGGGPWPTRPHTTLQRDAGTANTRPAQPSTARSPARTPEATPLVSAQPPLATSLPLLSPAAPPSVTTSWRVPGGMGRGRMSPRRWNGFPSRIAILAAQAGTGATTRSR